MRALILTPTRELADQVYESVKRYSSKQTPLRSAVVFGGVDIGPQREALRRGCEILVATPGRLLDHVEQKNVNLGQVGILVLDEADRMLDMGFLPDLERIIRLLPAQRQGLLFSATFSNEIRKLGRSYLNQPVEIEVAARNATANTITQIAYKMSGDNKRAAVVHLVKSRGLKQVIVFSNTKIGTARLARQLERDGVKAESIHGDKTQADRMKALEAFKAGDLKCWWPPTWPRAAWTWPACLASSTTTCRTTPKTTCTVSAVLAARARRASHRAVHGGRRALPARHREADQARVPRGTLDVPADLIARSHGRGEERGSPREGREGRDRGERGDRGRSSERGSERRSSYSAPRQPVDDFFLKPYEPSAAAGRPGTRRSSRTAPSARSPCCSAAAASPEGRRRIPTSVSRFSLRPARLIGLAERKGLAGAFSCGGSQAVSSGRQQRWQVGQAGRDGGAACVQAGKQAFEMADVRQHRTVEQHAVAELDQQGGEVLDFLVAEQFGVLLDIDPGEHALGHGLGQRQQLGLVLLAGVAPGGAETGDEPGVGRRAQARAQSGKIGTGNE